MQKKILVLEILLLILIVWTLFFGDWLKEEEKEVVVAVGEPTYRYIADPGSINPEFEKLLDPALAVNTESFLYNPITNPGATTSPIVYGAKGYYMIYDAPVFPLNYQPDDDPYPIDTKTCQIFRLTGASKEVFNRSYSNKDNYRFLFIDPNQLEVSYRNLLLTSNKDHPVVIQVKIKPWKDNLDPCISTVDLVSVIEIPPPETGSGTVPN